MWQVVLQAFFALLIATVTVAAIIYALFNWSLVGWLIGVLQRFDPRRSRPAPQGRPIEQIAQHARRLWRQSRLPERGRSRAKQVAISRAYDDVLAEGCEALGFPHLLRVLPPGHEHDVERDRVEDLLEEAGLRLRQLS